MFSSHHQYLAAPHDRAVICPALTQGGATAPHPCLRLKHVDSIGGSPQHGRALCLVVCTTWPPTQTHIVSVILTVTVTSAIPSLSAPCLDSYVVEQSSVTYTHKTKKVQQKTRIGCFFCPLYKTTLGSFTNQIPPFFQNSNLSVVDERPKIQY